MDLQVIYDNKCVLNLLQILKQLQISKNVLRFSNISCWCFKTVHLSVIKNIILRNWQIILVLLNAWINLCHLSLWNLNEEFFTRSNSSILTTTSFISYKFHFRSIWKIENFKMKIECFKTHWLNYMCIS